MSTPDLPDVPLLHVAPSTLPLEEACIEGTRETIFATIQKWLTSPDLAACRVLWLADISGSGKSTVAHHIAYTTKFQNHLLCSFCFKRDVEAQASTSRVTASLAAHLARLGGPIAAEIAQSSEEARAGSREEFHALITGPLCRHPPERPSLILIDALDESGLPFERAEFLTALTQEIPLLPPSVKVMVTSKPTQDIEDAFNKLSADSSDDDEDLTVYRLTFDVYGQENRKDLLKYISHKFGRVAQLRRRNGTLLPESWPSNEQRKSLVAHANGLFLWVSVAVNYVACAADPQQALDQLLALQNRPSPEAAIDALYKHILHVAEENPDFNLPTYHRVLGIILNSLNPLAANEISRILGQNAVPMIRCLMPVLVTGRVVKIVHQSFGDYVRDVQKCEPRFFILPAAASPGIIPGSLPGSPVRRDSSDSTYSLGSPVARLADVASHPWAQDLPAARDVSTQIDEMSISPYPVARGAFGDIWHARLTDGMEVAIKCIRLYGPVAALERRRIERIPVNELNVWSRLDHRNVLGLRGICVLFGEIGMVSKWMPNGNALDYTLKHPAVDRLRLIADIAAGLSYLHLNQIVHGDLKGGNVVISVDGTARLVDFGLAKMTEESLGFSTTSALNGTVRWMAFELLNPGEGLRAKATFASDVYALGMTALEILTGQPPFLNLINDAQVILAVTRGGRPSRPSAEIAPQMSDHMWELINCCWHQDREQRPSARSVEGKMQNFSNRGNSGGLHLPETGWDSSANGAH